MSVSRVHIVAVPEPVVASSVPIDVLESYTHPRVVAQHIMQIETKVEFVRSGVAALNCSVAQVYILGGETVILWRESVWDCHRVAWVVDWAHVEAPTSMSQFIVCGP